MPYNQDCIDKDDLDLGSGGPMLLPDQAGPHTHLMVSGSKEGRIYLLDRDNLGNFNLGSNSQIPQEILINPKPCGQLDVNNTLRIYGTPSYWNGFVYIGAVGSNLRAYKLTNGADDPNLGLQYHIPEKWTKRTRADSGGFRKRRDRRHRVDGGIHLEPHHHAACLRRNEPGH